MTDLVTQSGYQNSIYHIRVVTPKDLQACLHNILPTSVNCNSLLQLGSIYHNQKRVLTHNLSLQVNDILRVHTQPRRYNIAGIHWEQQIVHDGLNYIIIDKPPTIPSHPTLDNSSENALACMSQTLGQQLWGTHRLDQLSRGLLILAKSPNYAKRIHAAFAQNRIRKFYRALSQQPVQVGRLTHYMTNQARAPREVSAVPPQNFDYKLVQMEVLESRQVAQKIHLINIQLITGRTHQIRCQLAAIGSPILGDTLYGSTELFARGIALQCYRLELFNQVFALGSMDLYT